MKEKFLNVILFILSIVFIASGIIIVFFYKMDFVAFIKDYFISAFKETKLAIFFMQLIGSFLTGWGFFFLLMTVFTVMDLKTRYVYGFIFWVYTIWAAILGYTAYINNYMFLFYVLCGIYGVIFLPFLISILLKSKSSKEKQSGNV